MVSLLSTTFLFEGLKSTGGPLFEKTGVIIRVNVGVKLGIQIGVKIRVKKTAHLLFVVIYPCSPMIKLSELPKSHQQTCHLQPSWGCREIPYNIFLCLQINIYFIAFFIWHDILCHHSKEIQVKYSQTICTFLICLMGLIAGPKRGRPTPGISIFIRSFVRSSARL